MAQKIVKFSIRFSLENKLDKELWDIISQIPPGQRSAFIKGVLFACIRGGHPLQEESPQREEVHTTRKIPLDEINLTTGDL